MHSFGNITVDGEADLDPPDVRDEGISNFTDEMKKRPRELQKRNIVSLRSACGRAAIPSHGLIAQAFGLPFAVVLLVDVWLTLRSRRKSARMAACFRLLHLAAEIARLDRERTISVGMFEL
jgi:hypothetical protein